MLIILYSNNFHTEKLIALPMRKCPCLCCFSYHRCAQTSEETLAPQNCAKNSQEGQEGHQEGSQDDQEGDQENQKVYLQNGLQMDPCKNRFPPQESVRL